MSVKQDSFGDEPLGTNHGGQSQFSAQNLLDLNDPARSYASPLAVIGLVDLNAFFAQVEQIRLNQPDDAPVVCAQWQSLIAVSYAAREFGINRMDTIQSAKAKCPNLVIGHAAVFKKGESHWAYVAGLPHQAYHKVSLDPYRRESRKILRVLQQHCDLVEKASVDESYLDLGRLVYEKLAELLPSHIAAIENGSPSDPLPPIPSTLPASLQWIGRIYESEQEAADNTEQMMQGGQESARIPTYIEDWDDIVMLVGSQILHKLRQAIYSELGYYTSAGLARNKLIAKIAGGFVKPDFQTIIRNKSVHKFMNNFELNDITGLGGKLGDAVLQKFDVSPDSNSISYIRENISLETLKEEFRNDPNLAQKIYDIVRGNYQSPLTHKVDVKSMMSRKNFMNGRHVDTLQDVLDWIKVFSGDLYNRMIELDDESLNLSLSQLDSKDKGAIKRPKTVSVHFTTSSWNRHSKQTPVPLTRSLPKLRDMVERLGFQLIQDLLDNSTGSNMLNKGKSMAELRKQDVSLKSIKITPLANLSLTLSNFVKTNDSSLIDSYAGTNPSDKDNIKKMFDEVNNAQQLKQSRPEPVKKDMTNKDKEYIAKLFSDFEAAPKQIESNSPKKHTKKDIRKETKQKGPSKDDIKKMFDDYSREVSATAPAAQTKRKHSPTPARAPTSAPKRKHSPDILQSLKVQKPDSFLQQLHKGHCPKCNLPVEDANEHNDYHIALELSERLNQE